MTIYEELKKDHDKVLMLMDELIGLREDEEERRGSLVEQIRDELVPHARAEESVYYNSLRMLDATKDMAMHGYTEHMAAEGLLRMLQVKDATNMDWKATARKLRDALEHHIREEEGEMFDAGKQLFTNEEAIMMGEAFNAMKPEVREEGMMKNTLDMMINLMPPRLRDTFASSQPGSSK